MHELRLGTSFSGVEGFGLGFTLAGWSLEWTGEIDKHACRVLAARFPAARNTGDITRLAPEWLGDVDCYAFGFPCQDLSVAGHRAGLGGDRSGLFWEALPVIATKRPKWIVAENVPGLLSSNQGEDFGVVLWALASLGYGVAYAVLDARYFGVPQRRRRVFIVGCLGDAASARQVLADAPGGYWDPAARRGPGRGTGAGPPDGTGIAGTLRSNQRNNSNPASDPRVWGDPSGVARPTTTTSRFDPTVETIIGERGHPPGPAHLRSQRTRGAAAHNGGRHGGDQLGPPESPHHGPGSPEPNAPSGSRPEGPANGSSHPLRRGAPASAPHATGDGAPTGLPGWLDLPMWRTGRVFLHAEGTPDPIPSPYAPRPRQTISRRRRHCGCPDTPRYRETGNAVPVPIAYWLAKRIQRIHGGAP